MSSSLIPLKLDPVWNDQILPSLLVKVTAFGEVKSITFNEMQLSEAALLLSYGKGYEKEIAYLKLILPFIFPLIVYSNASHNQLLPEWLQEAVLEIRKWNPESFRLQSGNKNDEWIHELSGFVNSNIFHKVDQLVSGLLKLLLNTDEAYEKHINIRERNVLRISLVLEPIMRIIKFKKYCPPFFQSILTAVKGPKVIAFLLSYLEEEDYENLYFAAITLNNMRTIEADVALVKFLHVKRRRTALSRIFRSWNDERVLNLLEELTLQSNENKIDDPVRYLLGPRHQLPESWEVFKKIIHKHKVIRQSVIWLLFLQKHIRVVPFLIAVFEQVDAKNKFNKHLALSSLREINIQKILQQKEQTGRINFIQTLLSEQADLFPFVYLMTKDILEAKQLLINALKNEYSEYAHFRRPVESIFGLLFHLHLNNLDAPYRENKNFAFMDDLSEEDIQDYLNTLAGLKGIPNLLLVDFDFRVLLFLHDVRKFSRFQIAKMVDRSIEEVEKQIGMARKKARNNRTSNN